MIFLYSDLLFRAGGIETYLHALSLCLMEDGIPFRVVVAEFQACPLIDELADKGIKVYRQLRLPGDRWRVRQHFMLSWLSTQLRPGDWVYCVRQPIPKLYLRMVRIVHSCQAKIAASWMLAPEYLPPASPFGNNFCQAVKETDVVISVSSCTTHQFRKIYNYRGKVNVVPYHNQLFFSEIVPSPIGPPWKIGFIGRLDIKQKNLDTLLEALRIVINQTTQVELHLYGGGSELDLAKLKELTTHLSVGHYVTFHGAYDHRRDLPSIMANCHFFVYPSRFEGGPCFTLLEIMQAGRYCIASPVGGIPDLYEGYPEAGLLVQTSQPEQLATGIMTTLGKIEEGAINGEKIRERYFSGFDMRSAHRAWKSTLNVSI